MFHSDDDKLTSRFRALDAKLKARRDAALAEVQRTDASIADLRRTTERPAVDEAELESERGVKKHAS